MRHVHRSACFWPTLLMLLCVSANAEPLSVRLEAPTASLGKLALGYKSWDVFIEGELDNGSPGRIEAELEKLQGAPADFYFNSPGGNLAAGLEIGRLIRKRGYNTNVGRRRPNAERIQPGGCYSACAIAFLGGRYRYVMAGARIGFHRASASQPSTNDLDRGQIVSATLSSYIREMGVDGGLLDRLVAAGADQMSVLSQSEAVALGVVNNGREVPEWSVVMLKDGPYVRGSQVTVYGKGIVSLMCGRGAIVIFSTYDAGEERAAEIARGGWVHSLLVVRSINNVTK